MIPLTSFASANVLMSASLERIKVLRYKQKFTDGNCAIVACASFVAVSPAESEMTKRLIVSLFSIKSPHLHSFSIYYTIALNL